MSAFAARVPSPTSNAKTRTHDFLTKGRRWIENPQQKQWCTKSKS